MVQRNNGANLRHRLDGFTLIELLIVMVLLVLLAGVSLTVYGTSVQRGKEAGHLVAVVFLPAEHPRGVVEDYDFGVVVRDLLLQFLEHGGLYELATNV